MVFNLKKKKLQLTRASVVRSLSLLAVSHRITESRHVLIRLTTERGGKFTMFLECKSH